jgi:phage tail-like protein
MGGAGLVLGALVTMSSGTLGGAIARTRLKPAPKPAAAAKYFEVAIDGITYMNTDITGVGQITSVTEPGEEGTTGAVERTRYEPVFIMRRYAGPDEFWQWRQRIAKPGARFEPRHVRITYFDTQLKPVRTVELEDAWPSGWDLPGMDVKSPAVGNEVIRLTFTRAQTR